MEVLGKRLAVEGPYIVNHETRVVHDLSRAREQCNLDDARKGDLPVDRGIREVAKLIFMDNYQPCHHCWPGE